MGTLCSCGFSLSSLRIRRLTLEINCYTYSSKPFPPSAPVEKHTCALLHAPPFETLLIL
jgi:hypothetical protein